MNNKKQSAQSKKPVVVIEIGNEWVKMIQVEPARGGGRISRLHLERFSSFSESMGQSISKALKAGKFARGPIVGCLPRQMANIRFLELPSTDVAEIADMVDLQIGKQTPYSRDEIVSGYRIIGADPSGYTKVMLVIAQQSIVRERFHLLEEAGLAIDAMSVSTEGLLNWSMFNMPGNNAKTVMVIDIDATYADSAVMDGDKVLFSRSILIGAEQLLEDPAVAREKFVAEIGRSIEIFNGENHDATISRVILTGAAQNIEGLADELEPTLEAPVETVDSFGSAKLVTRKPDLQQAEYHAISLAPLVGMGASIGNLEFNLVPDAVRLRKSLQQKAKSLTALGILVMSVLIAASMLITLMLCQRTARLDELKKELEKIRPEANRVAGDLAIAKELHSRLDARRAPINVVRELHALIPQTIHLASVFVGEDGRVALKGMGKKFGDVNDFISMLEDSDLFCDAKGDQKSAKGQVAFDISCALEGQQ